MKRLFLILPFVLPLTLTAGVFNQYVQDGLTNRVVQSGWMNMNEDHRFSGPTFTPAALNGRVVIVHRWCTACKNIDSAVAEFQNLAKRYADTDFVFLTSYFPNKRHPVFEVKDALKRNKVTGPVYVGAAAMEVPQSRKHMALYVVSGGKTQNWFSADNTEMKGLERFLNAHRSELLEETLKLEVETAPGRALNLHKKVKRSDPKLAAKLTPLITTVNTPENRQMAEFEDKVALLREKANPPAREIEALREKLEKFTRSASPKLKDESDALFLQLGVLANP